MPGRRLKHAGRRLSGGPKSGILGCMRIKVLPQDFSVQEMLAIPLAEGGRYAVYRVEKRALTTLQVQARLAAALAWPRSAVAFPALKDKQAVAVQFGTLRGAGPRRIQGSGFVAERIGWLDRPLSPGDLAGNRFTVVLRDLGADEAAGVIGRWEQITRWGLPNYFDEQRFGSRLTNGEFPARAILRRDQESALRAHLAGVQVGDPPPVRDFKAFAGAHWGDWQAIFDRAPKPSNYRSVLTYLRHHPQAFRRALNLVTPRVLSLYLSAYQSWLWNRLAGGYLRDRLAAAGVAPSSINVAGETLPLYDQLPPALLAALAGEELPLLHHRVRFHRPQVEALVEAMLTDEGLQIADFKARLLTRAYMTEGSRSLLVWPRDLRRGEPEADERFAGRRKLAVTFSLPPGSYATLLLKALAVDKSDTLVIE
ncbi:MAG: tRNA pseudouridine(13) synthase TruD [Chloroflexota bacterium]